MTKLVCGSECVGVCVCMGVNVPVYVIEEVCVEWIGKVCVCECINDCVYVSMCPCVYM